MKTKTLRGSARTAPARQRGAVLVLFVAGMIAILAVAGLALDGAHQMLNKDRLQNTVDAAALNAAKVLDDTANTALAQTAAITMFADNANDAGNVELNQVYSGGGINLTVQFSQTVNPFAPGSGQEYVRVIATGFTLPAWLINVLGITQKNVAATAVAGPSPTIDYSCNLVPLIVCGDVSQDPADPLSTNYWGYDDGEVVVLKAGAQSNTACGPEPRFIGDGNFYLARLDAPGGAEVRDNLAGDYEGCFFEDDMVETEPGNTVGPAVQGMNTRLNISSGPISPGDYSPDVVTTQQNNEMGYDCDAGHVYYEDGLDTPVYTDADLDFNFDDYENRTNNGPHDMPEPAGVKWRRTLPVFVADCSADDAGQSSLPILDFGCFLLLQEVKQQGNEAEIYGEFAYDCPSPGFSGPDPTIVPGPHTIQLYHDSDSNDS